MRAMVAMRVMVCAVLCALTGFGCGWITDKGRIKVAKIDNRYITRGDLDQIISQMNPIPNIQTRGDVLRVLQEYINDQIKDRLGDKLAAAGKIKVSREQAAAVYDGEHPDEARFDKMRIKNNPAVVKRLAAYNLTVADLRAMKDRREAGIDKVLERLQGDAALRYEISQAVNNKTMSITDEEYRAEYKLRKATLMKYESIDFVAIALPLKAREEAAQIMDRIDAGEKFKTLEQEYYAKNPAYILRSAIENNPNVPKFRGFWDRVSGAAKGTVVGPVYMPGFQRMSQDANGKVKLENFPDAWLVLQVLDRTPAAPKTFEEAKPNLMTSILVRKMMERLRREHGVEVYENNLRDPRLFVSGE